MAPPIYVFSSLNEDVVQRVPSLPLPGQTIHCHSVTRTLGGKGANTAIAATLSSTAFFSSQPHHVHLVCATPCAKHVIPVAQYGVHTNHIQLEPSASPGRAFVTVDDSGMNSIIVHRGANALLQSSSLPSNISGYLVMHFETPLHVVISAATNHTHHVKVILNPSPIPPCLSDVANVWPLVDVLVVNHAELLALLGHDSDDSHTVTSEMLQARNTLRAEKADIVVTVGSQGAVLLRKGDTIPVTVKAPYVPSEDVVDTTGAGDCVTGFLTGALAAGWHIEKALQFAVNAASVSVQHAGAATSIPRGDQVLRDFPLPTD